MHRKLRVLVAIFLIIVANTTIFLSMYFYPDLQMTFKLIVWIIYVLISGLAIAIVNERFL